MPAISALSPEAWLEVRKAYELGVSIRALSQKYEIEFGTIRKRIQREKWVTLEDVQAKAVNMQKIREESLGMSTNVPKGVEVAAETLLANGEAGSLLMSQIGLASLKKAMTPEGMLKIAPLANIGDVVTAGKAVRLAAGMDKASSANVSVNLAMFSGQGEEKQAWSVVETQEES